MDPELTEGDCFEDWLQTKYYINDGETNSYLLVERGIHGVPSHTSENWTDIYKNNFYHDSWTFVVKEK